MTILNESISVALFLVLIFGAVFFYLYSRVTYVEKRISLMETILLDIKMNQEQPPVQFPHFPPNLNFHDVSHIPIVHTINKPETPKSEESLDKPLNIDPISEELYTKVLNDAHKEVNNEDTSSNSVLSVNYESMTKDELLEVAKKRGLNVGAKPGRAKLLQLIRKSETIEGTSSFEPLQEAVESDV